MPQSLDRLRQRFSIQRGVSFVSGIIPEVMSRSGIDFTRIADALKTDTIQSNEVVHTHEQAQKDYQAFLAKTIPQRVGRVVREKPVVDVMIDKLRKTAYTLMQQNTQTRSFPAIAEWIHQVVTPDYPQLTYRTTDPSAWRITPQEFAQAQSAYTVVLRNYSDKVVQHEAQLAHEKDPFIHPRTVSRSTVETLAHKILRRALDNPAIGKRVEAVVRRGVMDSVGIDVVRPDGKVLTLTTIPTHTTELLQLYELGRKLQQHVVAPGQLPGSANSTMPLTLDSHDLQDTFALALLLADDHPQLKPIAYYIYKQNRITSL